MITFVRENNSVKVRVEHGIFHSAQYFELDIAQGQEYQAELLRQALQENLNRHLSRIKRKYYEQGWKDCRKKGLKVKDRKQTDFYGGWEK